MKNEQISEKLEKLIIEYHRIIKKVIQVKTNMSIFVALYTDYMGEYDIKDIQSKLYKLECITDFLLDL